MTRINLLNRFKRFNRINRLFLILAAVIAGSGNVWGTYYATAYAYLNSKSPSGSAKVYAVDGLSNTAVKKETGTLGGDIEFNFTAEANSTYRFIGWTENDDETTLVSGEGENPWKTSFKASSDNKGNRDYKRYALFGNVFYATAYAEARPKVDGVGLIYVSERGNNPQQESDWTKSGSTDNSTNTAEDGTTTESSANITAVYYAQALTGYNFGGWYTDANCTQSAGSYDTSDRNKITITIATSNRTTPGATKTLYAKFNPKTPTITFNAQGGSVTPSSSVVTYGSTYGNGTGGWPTPTLTGYNFDGWYTAIDGGYKINSSDVVDITVDGTLYAHWTAKTYNLSIDYNGGKRGTATSYYVSKDNNPALTYDSGNYWDLSGTVPSRDSYTFAGYYDTNNVQVYDNAGKCVKGTAYWNENSLYKKDGDMTLTAHWTPIEYTITYNDTYGVTHSNPTKYTIETNTITFSAPTSSRTGYTFKGWSPASITKGSTGNKTVTAQWTAINYQINYNLNYGDAKTNLFTGWTGDVKSENTLSETYNPATGEITISGTLLANNSSMIYQVFPGVSSGDPLSMAVYGYTGSISKQTTDGGKMFLDLRTSSNTVTTDPKIQISFLNADVSKTGITTPTDYAKSCLWYWKETKNSNTVTFNNVKFKVRVEKASSLASVVSPSGKYVAYNSAFGTLANNPTRTGYTFKGWYTAASGGTKIETTTTNTTAANQVLYAQWTPDTHRVTYDAREGTVSPAYKDVTYDATYGELATPSRPGYKFDGWYTAASGGTQITSSTKVAITAAQTIYAHWTGVTVSGATAQAVSFTGRTETKTATLTFPVTNAASNSDFNAPTISGDAGWTITGWNYANNKVTVTLSFTATENTTTSGNHVATVTLKAKSNNQATGTVTANVNMVPAYTNNIQSSYLVEETTLDLNTLWTSTSNGTKTYSITEFTPSGSTTGGTTPSLSNNKISLTQSGTMKLQLTQVAGVSGPAGTTQTCTVVINKIDPTFTWDGITTGRTTNSSFTTSFSSTNPGTINVNNKTPKIAEYKSGTVYVYNTTGTATINLSQEANYKYNSKSQDYSFTVSKPNDHLEMLINSWETHAKYHGNAQNFDITDGKLKFKDGSTGTVRYTEYTFTGVPDSIFFSASSDATTNKPTFSWYYKTSTSGWTKIDSKNSKDNFNAKNAVNHDAVGIRLEYTGAANAGYVSNLRVTEWKKFEPTPTSLDFGIHAKDESVAAQTVKLSYATAGYKVKAETNDSHFTVTPTLVTNIGGDKYGTTNFTVSYSTTSVHTANGAKLTISDEFDNKQEIILYGTTKEVPRLSNLSASKAVTYGDNLSTSTPSGTAKNSLDESVTGSFAWNPDKVVTDGQGSHKYDVKFTPSNTNLYYEATGQIDVTVNRKTATMQADDITSMKLSMTDETKANLVNQITSFSPESDAYGHAVEKSAINYTIITNPGNAGHIVNKQFYATEAGTYTIRASFDQNDYYTAVSDDFTITVEKLENTVTINGQTSQTQTINYGDKLEVAFNADNQTGAYNVTRTAGSDKITYANQVITAGAGSSNQTATFTVSQAETNKYKGSSATITVNVNPVFYFAATASASTGGTATASVQDTKYENYGTTSSSTTATFTATPDTGYSFSSWSDGTTTATYTPTLTNNTAESIVTKSLTANFTANKYTVTFNAEGGTPASTDIQQTYNSKYILPSSDPTRTGYIFAGWWTETSGGKQVSTTTDVEITGAQTLHAQWTAKKYNLDLDYNGGEKGGATSKHISASAGTPLTYDKGNYCNMDWTLPTLKGYTLAGFFDKADESIRIYNSDGKCNNDSKYWENSIYKFDGDLNAIAHWNANTYYVQFDGNDATSGKMEKQLFTYDVAQNLTANAYSKANYVFGGWSDTPDGEVKYADGASVQNLSATQDSTKILYAYWIPVYQLNYNLNYEGANQTNLFTGWDGDIVSEETLHMTYDPATGIITANGTITNKNSNSAEQLVPGITAGDHISMAVYDWSAGVNGEQGGFTLDIRDTDGNVADNIYVRYPYDSRPTLEGKTIPTNYKNSTFWYWLRTKDGTQPATLANNQLKLRIEKSDTLATVASPSGKYVVYGSQYGQLANDPTRKGYTFDGWYTQEDGGTKVTADATYSINGNSVLYAHWTTIDYTVTLNDKGGSGGSGSVKAHYEEAMPSANKPSKEYHKFLGYFDAETGGTQYYTEEMASARKWDKEEGGILYAQWQDTTYLISFNHESGSGSMATVRVGLNENYTIPACTFTAPSSFTVTYNSDGGTSYDPVVVTSLEYTGWEDHGDINSTYHATLDPRMWTYDVFDAPYYSHVRSDIYATHGYNKVALINHYVKKVVDEQVEHQKCIDYLRGVYPTGAKVSHLTTVVGYTVPLYAQWQGKVILPTPTKKHHTFIGWYDGTTKVGNAGEEYIFTHNVTLTAHWSPSYTVCFDGNNATKGHIADSVFTFGQDYVLPSTGLTRQHTIKYTGEGTPARTEDKVSGEFQGWEDYGQYKYVDSKGKPTTFGNWPTSEVDSSFDAARYGSNAPDVRNNIEYGNGVFDKGLLFKHYMPRDVDPTQGGWKEYWIDKAEGRCPYVAGEPGYYPVKVKNASGDSVFTQVRNLTNIPGHLVTLKAHWKLTPDTVTLPTATRTGYTLNGWSDGTTTYQGKYVPNTSHMTIQMTSDWIANTYYVRFVGNGSTLGSMDNQEFTYDAAAKALTLNTYERAYTVSFNADGGDACADQTATYTFNNWNTVADGTGTTYTNGQSVQNLTSDSAGIFPLYAQWTPSSVTLPSTTKTGYSLTGWSDGTTTYAAGASYTPSANITLTAVWGALDYTVTFDKQQGTGGSDNVSATFNAAMPSATKPSRTGYTFQGYFAAAGGSGTKYYNADMSSAHLWDKAAATTLYAYWTANSYTVTFNGVLSGATVDPASKSVTYDAAYGTLATASHPSNRFDGWFTAADNTGTQVTAETVCQVADNHNLYAHWTQLYYSQAKVIASAKGCAGVYVTVSDAAKYEQIGWLASTDQTSNPVSKTTADGHMYYYFAKPSAGYTHKGWSKTDNGTIISGSAPDSNTRWVFNGTVTSTTTTYANPQWFTFYPVMTANQYKVTFDKQSGTGGSDDVMATYDAAMPSATAPTRDGYTFAGYYDAVSGGTQYYTTAMASARTWNKAAATTLYARWTAKQYTVTLNPNYEGAATKDVTATFGSAMPSMGAVPTRTGHKFTGYYDAQDGGTQYYTETGASARTYDKTSGCTLYAHWIGADFFTWNEGEALTFEATTTIPNSVAVAFSGLAVSYTSNNSAIVEVQANGTLLAKKAGSVSITATTASDPSDYFAVISETKTFTITKAKQSIVWEQNFAGLQTDDDPVTLTAYAVDTLGNPTSANISYAVANTSVAKVENGQIVVVGKGETTITATATSEIYRDITKTLMVVVRTSGEPCNTTVYKLTNTTASIDDTPYEVILDSVPYDSISIKIKKTAVSWISTVAIVAYDVNGGTHNIQTYSQDDVTATLTEYKIALDIDVPLTKLTITRTSGLLSWTMGDIKVKQSSYLHIMQDSEEEGKLTKIARDWIISTPFDTTFLINFCDKPVISARVTNHNGLKLTREQSAEFGGCGAYGTYKYKLSSTHTWSKTKVTLRDTIFVLDGIKADSTAIPIALTMKTGEGYYFINKTGDHLWSTINNWETSDGVPTKLPTAINPVTIQDTVIITEPVEVYQMALVHDAPLYANIIIEPTGGLSIYKSIYYGELTGHLLVKSSIDHTGYFRVAPQGVAVWTNKPTFTMQYATKGTLDNGANKDATWQYFGIPVKGANFEVDYITWLYEWSEGNGWIDMKAMKQPVTMAPFQGYAITQYGKPIYDFTGPIIMDSVTLNLTAGGAMAGDNMIANSFPAPLDAKRFTADDFEGSVNKTFYIFNSGSWNQWNDKTNGGVDLKGDAPGTFTEIAVLSSVESGEQSLIAPMQGICVHANDNNAKIHLNYSKHVWDAKASLKDNMNAGLHSPMRRSGEGENLIQDSAAYQLLQREWARQDSIQQADEQRIKELTHRVRIEVYSPNGGGDHVCLLEKPQYSASYDDGYDAPVALNEGILSLYTNEPDGQMAVSATNNVDSMFIGFIAGEDTEYKLHVSSILGEPLYLMDMQTDEVLKMDRDTTISFTAVANSRNDMRFRILKQYTTGGDVSTSLDATGANTQVWFDGKNLHITDAPYHTAAMLYSVSGQLLSIHHLSSSATSIALPNLSQGVYLLRIGNKVMRFTKE